ncbi:hypothetical protein C7N43_19360 [Sphingobacteriales bacterium UPWRP_1]|nr:hypothetical protein C7N43_19360 [Sphingobacteriales bacterium UPWRP_1]
MYPFSVLERGGSGATRRRLYFWAPLLPCFTQTPNAGVCFNKLKRANLNLLTLYCFTLVH